MHYWILLVIAYGVPGILVAQEQEAGNFFGGIQLNTDFYIRDSFIGAAGTPHYDNLKSSTDSWLNLNYVNHRYQLDAGFRLDIHNNSNLHHPGVPYSKIGIGNFYVRKRMKYLQITGGYFYDQFGSGIVFRAYEDRSLGIDNAILGIHLVTEPLKQMKLKAFTGVQKNRLALFKPIVTGINTELNFQLSSKVSIMPGFSVLNRVLDEASMQFIVSTLETYDPASRFIPRYNVYVCGGYLTLNAGNFTWYAEGAGKTREAIYLGDSLVNRSGHVLYSTLEFSVPRFGFALQFKQVKNFPLRTSPKETLLEGVLNFIPPITRQNALRLPARYNAVVQELSEAGYSVDLHYTPAKGFILNLSYAETSNEAVLAEQDNAIAALSVRGKKRWGIARNPLFREVFAELNVKKKKNWQSNLGFQFVQYHQEAYEGEKYGEYTRVYAYTPFADFNYRISRKHALKAELQIQITNTYQDPASGAEYHTDYGNWLYGLLEYSFAPWFSVALSDMYNFKPNPNRLNKDIHYYNVFASFTYQSHVLTLAYVRQVAGIVCTGGVCRYEPAFNGIRLTFNSTF
ncbi:MAG: hypothetical protein KatS3mg031_2214 [Chitinophagales bacterium]|nr:MAG: hypothetical protein KatS3mg031_2214 [Chitinophagales bacterium]